MSKIQKHTFEPVSLLTVENGILELAIIPAENQPDWVVPKSLILSIEAFDERIWTYLWNNQEVAVYHLVPRESQVDKLVVIEGNTDVHRLAMQTSGEIEYKNVRISDVKDVTLPENIIEQMIQSIPKLSETKNVLEYIHQAIVIDGEHYLVPELDLIAHHLVDLDS